jgi:hypothetical protein
MAQSFGSGTTDGMLDAARVASLIGDLDRTLRQLDFEIGRRKNEPSRSTRTALLTRRWRDRYVYGVTISQQPLPCSN